MYEMTAFYLYKVVFCVELLIAETMISGNLQRQSHFALRLSASFAVCIGIAFALPILAYNVFYCSFLFLLMFAVTLPLMKFCYDENTAAILFCAVVAYTVQHTAYQVFDLAMLPIGNLFLGSAVPGGIYGSGQSEYFPIVVYAFDNITSVDMVILANLLTYGIYLFVYFVVYAVSLTVLNPILANLRKFKLEKSNLTLFVLAFSVFNIFVGAAVTYYGGNALSPFFYILLGVYNICCCCFILFVMTEVILRKQFQKEYQTATYLWHKDKEQYDLMKENISLINLKCHDLKHQIHRIGQVNAVDSAVISDIENIISIYDSGVQTGNEALDVILTEKSLLCQQRGIRFYCIADGKLLDFIDRVDLYALFGNLVDNAIEAVSTLPSGERFIKLFVGETNGFPVIRMFNRYRGEIRFRNGLPVTTKENKDFHGFGVRSIRLICEKYRASCEMQAEDSVFRVGIVFVPET